MYDSAEGESPPWLHGWLELCTSGRPDITSTPLHGWYPFFPVVFVGIGRSFIGGYVSSINYENYVVSTNEFVFQTLEAAEAEGELLYHVFDPVTKSDTIWPEKVIIAGLLCSTQHKFPLAQDQLSYLPWLPVVAHDWSDICDVFQLFVL